MLLALALGSLPSAAHANGDPASDVLLTDTVFLGYTPPSKAVEQKLRATLDSATSKGQPVRVALIATRQDLGAVPDFFGKPVEYAKYLADELAAYSKLQHPNQPNAKAQRDPLIIVMPSGVGTNNVPDAVASDLRKVDFGGSASSDELASAGCWGVQELAKANGTPIAATFKEPPKESGGGGGGSLLSSFFGRRLLQTGDCI